MTTIGQQVKKEVKKLEELYALIQQNHPDWDSKKKLDLAVYDLTCKKVVCEIALDEFNNTHKEVA